jgi:hypothetical protein
MNTLFVRRSAPVLVLGLFTVLSSGCIVPGDGYGYDDGASIGIGVGYYEPYGAYYGGWDPGYRAGPIYGNNYRPSPGGRPIQHAYKPAPGSRPVPSIPARRRSDNVQQRHPQ